MNVNYIILIKGEENQNQNNQGAVLGWELINYNMENNGISIEIRNCLWRHRWVVRQVPSMYILGLCPSSIEKIWIL